MLLMEGIVVLLKSECILRARLVLLGVAAVLMLFPGLSFSETLMPGANLVQLTTDGKSRAWQMSSRGNWIAYLLDISNTQAQLRVMTLDGSEDRAVSPVGNPFFVQWSWGGDRLSYEFTSNRELGSQGNVFIYDLAGDRSYTVSQTYSYESLFGGRRFGRGGRPGGGVRSRPPRQDERPGLNQGPFADGPYWSADDKFVAFSLRTSGGEEEVWVSDSVTGRYQRILPQRSGVGEQRWSPNTPARLVLQVTASGIYNDIATVNANGTGLTMLTNIGSDSVRNDDAVWSPTGEWVAYLSDLEMTEDEQQRFRSDVWVARPDGSEARNLTQATSNSTEDQLAFRFLQWSWDGKWILASGNRHDQQGRRISTTFLVNPEGGYEVLHTSDPAATGEAESLRGTRWSYDSTKFATLMRRNRVRNWTTRPEFEDSRTGVAVYDLETRQMHEILFYSEERDAKKVDGQVTWSPDGKSLLITVNKVISSDDGIMQPDVYRLELPPELVSPEAARFHGPPIGVGARAATLTVAQAPGDIGIPSDLSGAQPIETTDAPSYNMGPGEIIVIVEPQHLTVAEIDPLIPSVYKPYLQSDSSRNIFVFAGPEWVHEALLADLEVIDYPAEHIMVDLLAIETSDAITRELGLDWAYTEGRFSLFAPEGRSVADFTPGFQISPPVLNQEFNRIPNFDIADRFDVNNVGDLLVGGLGTFPGTGQGLFSGVSTLPREFFVHLNALQLDGEITILANPRTVATSGKESVIQIRRVVNFFFTEGINLATGTPNVRKSDVTATTEGRITPTLLADGKVHMVLDINVGTITFGAEDLPQQTDRKATTEVTVAPGDTIIIGGLRQQEHKITETRTPILGSIPFLGKLFRKTLRENRHSVLTILITPRVMGQEAPPITLPDPEWAEFEMDDRYRAPIMNNGSLDGKPDNTNRPFQGSERGSGQ